MDETLKIKITAVTDGLRKACSEAKEAIGGVSDATEQAGSKSSKVWNGIKTGGKIAAGAFVALTGECVAAGKAIWDVSSQVAAYGDEIDKNSQKVGLSATSYQKWDYAMNIAGTSMADCTVGLKTLTNKFDDAINGSKSANETFERLGLSIDDLKGKSREDVFATTVTALQNVTDETEKAALANDLFGKSGQNLMPLFNMTEEELNEVMADTEKYGMLMGEDAVKASAQFQDSLTKLQSTFTGVKNNLISNFLPGITSIMDGLSGVIAGVDGAEKQLADGVSQTLQAVTNTVPKILDILATVIDGIIQALPPMIPQLISTVTDVLLKILDTIVTYSPMILDACIQAINQVLIALAQALPTILPKIVEALIQIVQTIIDELPTFLDACLQLILSFVEAIVIAIPQIIEALPQLIDSIINYYKSAIPMLIDAGIKLFTALVEALPEIINAICAVIPDIIDSIMEALVTLTPLIIEAGIKLFIALVQNYPKIIATIVSICPKILTSVIKGIVSGVSKMASAGVELVKGLWQGLGNSIGWIKDKIKSWVGDVLSFVKRLFGIHSPSKVFAGFGKFLSLGLGEGLEDSVGFVTSAVKDTAEAVEKAFNPNLELVPDTTAVDTFGRQIGSIGSYITVSADESRNSWGQQLVNMLTTANNKPIYLQVDGKTFAATAINTINDLTKQTGNLGLVIA